MLDLNAVRRIAAAYPPEARFTTRSERERYFTPQQKLAWLVRFDPEAAAEMLSAYDQAGRAQKGQHCAGAPDLPHSGAHHG